MSRRARIIDWLLLVPYAVEQVLAAFSLEDRISRRNWWLRRRPSVVALWERTARP